MERVTAKKCTIKDLLQGNYVVKEGITPNYVASPRGELAKINLVAAIVVKQQNGLLLDDGSGQIEARVFNDVELGSLEAGTLVQLIGRPRDNNGEIFLSIEIVKKIDPLWLRVRKNELQAMPTAPVVEKHVPVVEPVKEATPPEGESPKVEKTENVLDVIRRLDSGSGVSIEMILQENPDAEPLIERFMAEGEIFELKPGVVKLLE